MGSRAASSLESLLVRYGFLPPPRPPTSGCESETCCPSQLVSYFASSECRQKKGLLPNDSASGPRDCLVHHCTVCEADFVGATQKPLIMETLAKAAAVIALPAAAWYVLLAPSKPKKKAHRGRKANKKKKEVVAAPPAPAPAAPAPAPAPAPDPVRVPKAAPPPRPKPKPRRPLATTSVPAGFSNGDKVEARFGGGEDFFKATVTGSKPLGGGKYSYALAYDDGATETGVAASFIRRVGGAAAQAVPAKPIAQAAPAPELDGLVAYSKGGAPAPTAPRTSHAASLTAKPRPRATNDDDDDDAFDPVQSVDDWKKAAPKPRRPAVARPDIAARKAAQAEKNDAARRAEINRKKKEKKKAKKLEVREHFRQTL